jgi:hypothetical protein
MSTDYIRSAGTAASPPRSRITSRKDSSQKANFGVLRNRGRSHGQVPQRSEPWVKRSRQLNA